MITAIIRLTDSVATVLPVQVIHLLVVGEAVRVPPGHGVVVITLISIMMREM